MSERRGREREIRGGGGGTTPMQFKRYRPIGPKDELLV